MNARRLAMGAALLVLAAPVADASWAWAPALSGRDVGRETVTSPAGSWWWGTSLHVSYDATVAHPDGMPIGSPWWAFSYGGFDGSSSASGDVRVGASSGAGWAHVSASGPEAPAPWSGELLAWEDDGPRDSGSGSTTAPSGGEPAPPSREAQPFPHAPPADAGSGTASDVVAASRDAANLARDAVPFAPAPSVPPLVPPPLPGLPSLDTPLDVAALWPREDAPTEYEAPGPAAATERGPRGSWPTAITVALGTLALAGVAVPLAAATPSSSLGKGLGTLRRLLRGLLGGAFYAKLRREQVLAHPVREALVDAVRAEPGAHAQRLRRALGLGWGSLTHHLRVLEAWRLVAVQREGNRTLVFPADVPFPERRRAAALAHPSALSVFEAIRETPGSTQQRLAAALGRTHPTVSWHARRLERAGLIRVERRGRRTAYFAVTASP